MKRFLCLVLSFLSITGLLSGCVQEVDPEAYLPTGEALIMEGEDPYAEQEVDDGLSQQLTLMYYPERSMNPLVATDFTNRALFSLIYQGLFFVDEDYNAVPILCKNYRVSADNRTYTFYLENARFTDGSPVTALDVVATYEQAMATGYYSGRFTYLDRVEIAQDGGIDFYLTTPYENFPLLLDVPILKADELEDPNPKGTGPYLLVNQLTGAYLQRNRTWWCSSPDLVVTAGSIPLKEGLKWSDGADLTAKDFEFAWKRAASSALGADYGYMFEVIKGYPDELAVEAIDDVTLTVTLNNAVAYWNELLAFPTYFPVREDVVANEGWATDTSTYVSNGAYTMTGWEHNSTITLTKNENYHGADEVSMKEIKFYLSDDANNMLTNFKNGTWQLIDDVPTNEIAALKAEFPTEFVIAGQIGTYYVCWNINEPLLPVE